MGASHTIQDGINIGSVYSGFKKLKSRACYHGKHFSPETNTNDDAIAGKHCLANTFFFS